MIPIQTNRLRSNRVSLARFGIKDTQLAVDRLPDGGLVLHEAVALTATELAHLRDPGAVEALDRAWEDVAAGRVHPLPD